MTWTIFIGWRERSPSGGRGTGTWCGFPRMLAEGGQAAETSNEKFFFRSVRTEAALAAIVLLLAAILAFLPPAREHVAPAGPAAAKIRGIVRDRDG